MAIPRLDGGTAIGRNASPDRPGTICDGRLCSDHPYTRRRSIGTLGKGMHQPGVTNVHYGSDGQDTKVSTEDTAAIRTSEDTCRYY